jgi:hypothetical protein
VVIPFFIRFLISFSGGLLIYVMNVLNPAGTFTFSVDPLSVAKRVEAADGSSTMTAVTTQSPWGLPYGMLFSVFWGRVVLDDVSLTDSSYECKFGTQSQCPLTIVPENS